MKRFMLAIALLIFLHAAAFAQDYTVDYSFNNGYTLVYKTPPPSAAYQNAPPKTYGVINSAKKIVVPMAYKSIMASGENGVFIIKDGLDNAGLFSAISQKVIVAPEYFDIEPFREGLAVVKKRKPDYDFLWGAVDVNGKTNIPVEYDYLGPCYEGLINFKKNGKLGFIDKTNKVIIPPMYDDFSAFNEGLAAVKTIPEGKYGYIDKNNNMVIAAQYEDASPFYSGYAVVAKKKGASLNKPGKPAVNVPGEFTIINKTGKEILQTTYNRISSHNTGGLFVVELKDKKGVIDSTGKILLAVENTDATVDKAGNINFKSSDKKYGLMNSKGSIILNPEYDFISSTNNGRFYSTQKGRQIVWDVNKKMIIPADSAGGVIIGKKKIVYYYNDKVKVFDVNGKLLKTIADLNLKNYGHRFTITEDSLNLNSDATAQLINLANNTKIILPFSEAGDFNEEGIFIGKNLAYNFYDHTGKKLNTESYFSVVNFSEGIAALQVSSASAPHLADKNFNKIKDLYTYFKGPYSEGLAYATNAQYGTIYYLDKSGYEAFNIKAKEGSKCTAGFIIIKDNNNRFYHVNKKGKPINAKTWEEAGAFIEGLSLVKENGKWGFIDTLGKKVIDTKFELSSGFSKGAAMVKLNDKYFLINKKGEAVNNTKYEAAGNPDKGTFPVQKDKLVGLIDSKGNTIIDFKYESILYMSEDRVWAAKGGRWGLLDNKGKALTEFIYQGAYDFDNGFARVVLNDKIGVVNKAGKLIVPAEYRSLGSIYKNTIIGIKPAETVVYPIK